MLKFAIPMMSIISLAACQGITPMNESSSGRGSQQTVFNQGGSVGGNLTQQQTIGSPSLINPIDAKQDAKVNVALDSDAIKMLFGGVSAPIQAEPDKLEQVKAYANTQPDQEKSEINKSLQRCMLDIKSCHIVSR